MSQDNSPKRKATPSDILLLQARLHQVGLVSSIGAATPEEARNELASDPDYGMAAGHAFISGSAFEMGKSGRVYLGYGGHRVEDGATIGQLISSVLEEEGIEFQWNGDPSLAISIATDVDAFNSQITFDTLPTGHIIPDEESLKMMWLAGVRQEVLAPGEYVVPPMLVVTSAEGEIIHRVEWTWTGQQVQGLGILAQMCGGALDLLPVVDRAGEFGRFGSKIRIYPWRLGSE